MHRSIRTRGRGERMGRVLSREIKDKLADWPTFFQFVANDNVSTTNVRFEASIASFPLPELRGFPRNRSSTIYNRVFSNICDDCPQRISI